MTFQELADKITLEGIFTGTSVDQATQESILEWFFDYELCSDEATFLRYFRRRCNETYQRYTELIRIETVANNLDPFITNFMEYLTKDTTSRSGSILRQKSGTNSGSHSSILGGSDAVIDAPNLTEQRTPNLTELRSPDLTSTHTPDLRERTDKNLEDRTTKNLTDQKIMNMADEKTIDTTDMEAINRTDGRSINTYDETTYGKGDTTTTQSLRQSTESESADSDVSSKTNSTSDVTSRSFSAQYPEANLGSIPTSVDGYPTTVSYLTGESDNLSRSEGVTSTSTSTDSSGSKSGSTSENITVNDRQSGKDKTEHGGTDTLEMTGTDTTSHTGTETTRKSGTDTDTHTGYETESQSGYETKSTSGREITTERGSETTTMSGSETVTKRGTDTKTTQYGKTETRTDGVTTAENSSDTTSGTETANGEKTLQGRTNESVADIMPRAIGAIIACEPFIWLVKELNVCFVHYVYI